jgi:LDH2 family malate/lactate/ureidoglycolate dehydrogenase
MAHAKAMSEGATNVTPVVKIDLVPAERVRAQIVAVLDAWGMDADVVATTAEVMLETDLVGVDSHGVSMLMSYDEQRRRGKLNLKAKPRVVRENAATALIDADAGLGHFASVMGMNLAIDKAKAQGIGAVSVFNSHHFGAAGYYAAMAAKLGLLGLVTSSARGIMVVPTRAAVPVLGTNPIAFAAPTSRNNPFHLDIATATVAANKVKVYDLNAKPIPSGWVSDERGEPIRDAALAMDYLWKRDVGGLTPLGSTPAMASHKGYGLSMMAHILGAVLSGGAFPPILAKTRGASDPDNVGHFFLAIDPSAFRLDGAFESELDAIIDVLHASQPLDEAEPVLVAGDPEVATRSRRLQEGIPIPASLAEKIRAVCEGSGAPYLLP